MSALLDKFVCVRMVQGWGLDLATFQFDTDLTWAVFFMNADKTIYGRYGTRSGHDAMKEISLQGFKKAAAAALDLDKGYPANKRSLAAKSGPAPKWKTPQEIPTLAGKHKAGDLSRWGCVHCHMIFESQVTTQFSAGKPSPDSLLWKYPMPDVIGLGLDPGEMATVASVGKDSPADKAGFRVGDRILDLEGQPMISIADVQFVLNNAPESGKLQAKVERERQPLDLKIPLVGGWRRKGDWTAHESAWMIEMALMGCGLANDSRGPRIAHVGAKENNAATKAGLRKDDIIVGVDGKKSAWTRSEFLSYVVQKKAPGQTLLLEVLRAGKTLTLTLAL